MRLAQQKRKKKTSSYPKILSVLLIAAVALCNGSYAFSAEFNYYRVATTATAHWHGVIEDSDTAPTQLDVNPNTTTGYGFSLSGSSVTVPGRFEIWVHNQDSNLDLWCGFDNVIGTATKSAIRPQVREKFAVSPQNHLFCCSSTTIGPIHKGASINQFGVK